MFETSHAVPRWPLMLLVMAAIMMTAALPLVPPAPIHAQGDDDTIRVGLVIKGADGITDTHCVTVPAGATGLDALEAAEVDLIYESSSRGVTICQIGDDGCSFPDEHCFCQCMGGESCTYWAYFRLLGDNWQYNIAGVTAAPLANGAVEGWWWRDNSQANAAPPEPLPFEAICPTQPAFPRTVIDGMGREVTLEAAPQRIASVTLGSDEILFELVDHSRILGVTHFADDPNISNIAGQLQDIPHTDLSGNPEYLISLNADLVILAAYNNPAALDQLLDANVPVFALQSFNTIEDIRTNIRLLGSVTGEEDRAEALIAEMDRRIETVQQAVADQEPVRVLYYEPGGITYGEGSTVDEIITLAGGINVVAEADLGPYPLVGTEFLLASDPDVILVGGWFSGNDSPLDMFETNEALRALRAVRNGHVYQVTDAHMTNVSHHIAQGVEDIAHILYPQAFPPEEDAS